MKAVVCIDGRRVCGYGKIDVNIKCVDIWMLHDFLLEADRMGTFASRQTAAWRKINLAYRSHMHSNIYDVEIKIGKQSELSRHKHVNMYKGIFCLLLCQMNEKFE